MYIHEAVKKAMRQGKGITRGLWEKEEQELNIIPTNTTSGMIIDSLKSKTPIRRWQPRAEDLLANDWKLRC